MKREDNALSRRDFLKIMAITGAAGAALKLGLSTSHRPHKISRSSLLMGTRVTIILVAHDKRKASRAADRCLHAMGELESVLSRYQPDSELSRLNGQGRLQDAHPALLHIIQQSLAISRDSNGAFDITVKPLVDLYQRYHKQYGTLPPSHAVQRALSLVNHDLVNIEGTKVWFDHPHMEITLDGTAKGYIVDQGIQVLREHGFSRVMVEAGGDLFAGELGYNNQPWRVGIQHPRPAQGQDTIASVTVADQAVATSGDYHHTYQDDFQAHHILDPRTGVSPVEIASATVIAPETMLADTLSTTLLVMGLEEGLEMIERRAGCQAVIITKDLDMHTTSNLSSETTHHRMRES